MNIVVVTPSWPQDGNPNGIVTYYTNLIPALIELGHTVNIVTFQSTDDSDNVQVIDYRPSLLERIWCKFKNKVDVGYSQYYLGSQSIIDAIEKVRRKAPIDIVQMEDSFGWHQRVQAAFPFPVVMRLHGPYFLNSFEKEFSVSTKNRIKREEKAFLAAKFITSPSANVLDATKERYGQSWLVADVIANSMQSFDDQDQWCFEKVEKQQILFVGRFDNHKGGDVMLHAFFKLKCILPDATLVFIGPDRGLEENGEQLNVSRFLDKYGYDAEGSVQFLGKQNKEMINRYRATSHITVVASRYETFGNVALEAIACGSPLVCSNSGALVEIIEDGHSGLLYDNENSDQLADKMYQLLVADDTLLSLSSSGLERARQVFSPSAAAASTIDSFSSVISHCEK